ncbi:MAG TPA: hypothetical protein VFG63_05225 [Nocardioidaceae bacterium]|nr:hypothetical protein [Nocardioidaceae bacterium]
MTVVLLVCVLLWCAIGVWAAHRRLETVAWNQELEAAFPSADREMPRHRML